MDKKYQVFISSTYQDLIEERKIVQDIILTQDCIPAGMESFVATDSKQFDVIKRVIDLCDYYILIIGKRYGSINDETGLSYTEMEYDYAVEKGIPVLVFCIDDKAELEPDKIEQDEDKKLKLKALITKSMKQRMGGMWRSHVDLIRLVSASISKAKITEKRPGWIRGDYKESEEVQRLKSKIENLKKENENLKSESRELAFDNYSYTIKYSYYTRNKNNYSILKKSKKKTTLSEIFKFLSMSISGYCVTKDFIDTKLKDFINDKQNITLEDSQIVEKLLNQFENLNFLEKEVKDNCYKYKLTAKGEKIKNELNLFYK